MIEKFSDLIVPTLHTAQFAVRPYGKNYILEEFENFDEYDSGVIRCFSPLIK